MEQAATNSCVAITVPLQPCSSTSSNKILISNHFAQSSRCIRDTSVHRGPLRTSSTRKKQDPLHAHLWWYKARESTSLKAFNHRMPVCVYSSGERKLKIYWTATSREQERERAHGELNKHRQVSQNFEYLKKTFKANQSSWRMAKLESEGSGVCFCKGIVSCETNMWDAKPERNKLGCNQWREGGEREKLGKLQQRKKGKSSAPTLKNLSEWALENLCRYTYLPGGRICRGSCLWERERKNMAGASWISCEYAYYRAAKVKH